MSFKKWIKTEENTRLLEEFSRHFECGELVSAALINAGIDSLEDAERFLAKENPVTDPYSILDMDKAVARIASAVREGERIEIFGDYDVDGITATTILYLYLESIGADVVCSLPLRDSAQGYGISERIIDRMARDGVSLIITVDNGISANSAVDYALSKGIDTVITDHHKVSGDIPAAVAVVDPLRSPEDLTHCDLAGVGVALQLIAAMEGCNISDIMDMYGPFAALGTISDVMNLSPENRYIVSHGLTAMKYTENLGLLKLAEATGTDLAQVDEKTVAFIFAPRINAAGRMSDASIALELFLTEDEARATALAEKLCSLNTERQSSEKKMFENIEKLIAASPEYQTAPALIFSSPDFESGVSGIVCSRLTEKYSKPTIIITEDGEYAKGSGRSTNGLSLYDAINSCQDCLVRYGGHEMAAGFTLRTEDVPEFKQRICEAFASMANAGTLAELKVIPISDANSFTVEAVENLRKLAPFGCGNPEPVYALFGVRFVSISTIGDRHSRLTFTKDGMTFAAAYFGKLPSYLPFSEGAELNIAVCVDIYECQNGSKFVSFRIEDIQPANIDEQCFESWIAYNSFIANNGQNESAYEIKLDRDVEADVFRTIKQCGGIPLDPVILCAKLPQYTPGTTMAAVDVLCELEFCRKEQGFVILNSKIEKRDLSESRTYQLLS